MALPGGGSRGRVVSDAVHRHSEVAGPEESEEIVEQDRVREKYEQTKQRASVSDVF